MSRKMRNFLILLAALTAGSFLAAGFAFTMTGGIRPVSTALLEISESKEFEAEDIKQIEILTVSTKVRVLPSSDQKIRAEFTGDVTSSTGGSLPRMDTVLDQDRLVIRIAYPSPFIIGFLNLSDLNLDVYVPAEDPKEISVSTTSGAVLAQGLATEKISAKSVSGKIDLEMLSAQEIKVSNTSGRVGLIDVEGALSIDTVSGRISASLGTLQADIRINSISGTVELSIPEDSGFAFRLASTSGSIDNRFDADVQKSERGLQQGLAGEAQYNIDINTVSGSIVLGQYP